SKMNPMDLYNNWNKWYTQYQAASNWSNLMNQFNPGNAFDAFKSQSENFGGFFNQYQELVKSSFTQLTENLQNVGSKDAFSNMMNVSSAFTKFNEIWAPFWKSIQDKTFNAEQFKKNLNFDAYKD